MMDFPSLRLDDAMRLAALIAAAGIVWDAVELTVFRQRILGQFFDWRVIRSRYYILIRRPVLTAVFDTLLSGRVFATLVVLHAMAATAYAVVLPVSRPFAAVLAGLVLVVHLFLHVRLLVGLDGADQMQTVVWAGLLVYALDVGPVANAGAAVFICAQLVLSYLVSGGAKLVSRTWRSGTAIARITRAGTYSSPGVSRAMQHRATSFAVSWAVIGFELFGPLAVLGGPLGVTAFIVMGAIFHIGIALFMGLSTFVFAFLATYPILYALIT